MVGVNVRLAIGIVAHTICLQAEQRVVRVEHCFGELNPEVTSNTTSVLALLTLELEGGAATEFPT